MSAPVQDQEIPETMACVEIAEGGGPEVLRPARRPVPRPRDGEVLIRVAAAGINGPDIYQRQGLYPAPPGASDLPGLEVAGIVVEMGADVSAWRVGDKVCALLGGGGYAEYATAPAGQCLAVPKGLSLTEAAALPETFFTVWTNLYERARLRAGEVLLVHGGGGGIGTTAIQVASRLGARVFTTEGTAEKCAALVELGAERAINFTARGLRRRRQGGDGWQGRRRHPRHRRRRLHQAQHRLPQPGRAAGQHRLPQGQQGRVDLMPVMLKRLTLTGSTLRVQSDARKAEIAAALQETVWPLIAAGEIRPLIHRTLPLAEAGEAHRIMESASHMGKIMLAVNAL